MGRFYVGGSDKKSKHPTAIKFKDASGALHTVKKIYYGNPDGQAVLVYPYSDYDLEKSGVLYTYLWNQVQDDGLQYLNFAVSTLNPQNESDPMVTPVIKLCQYESSIMKFNLSPYFTLRQANRQYTGFKNLYYTIWHIKRSTIERYGALDLYMLQLGFEARQGIKTNAAKTTSYSTSRLAGTVPFFSQCGLLTYDTDYKWLYLREQTDQINLGSNNKFGVNLTSSLVFRRWNSVLSARQDSGNFIFTPFDYSAYTSDIAYFTVSKANSSVPSGTYNVVLQIFQTRSECLPLFDQVRIVRRPITIIVP